MAKADFITSLVLIVLGIGVVVESWRMPRFTDQGTSIWSAPGVTPGMVGLVLAILGLALLFRSRQAAAAGSTEAEAPAPSRATIVFSNVGASGLLTIASMSARNSRTAFLVAGR